MRFCIALLKEFSLFGLSTSSFQESINDTTLIFSQNVRIYSSYFVKEGLSLSIKICAMEKKMRFNTITAAAHQIY